MPTKQTNNTREQAFIKWLNGLAPRKQGYALGYVQRIIEEKMRCGKDEQEPDKDSQ